MPSPLNPHPPDSTKEIRDNPYFQGAISRWLWRFYTHRLTRPGAWFFALTSVFALYGATSLDLQVFVPFTYAMGVWLTALAWAQALPPRVRLTARHAARIEAGRMLPVEVEVASIGRAVYDAVLVPVRLPPAIDAERPGGVTVGVLRPGEPKQAIVALHCVRRGRYVLRGFRVQTDLPFGILRAYALVLNPSAVLVTPQFTPLASLELPARRSSEPGGAALSTARGESLEFMGDREFREGDSIRDMDWRASARLDRLVVREFREEYLHRAAIVLDTCAANGDDFEGAVSLCAAASDILARQQVTVDFVAAGPAFVRLQGGHGEASHDAVLDLLAAVEPSPVWEAALEMRECLEQISAAVCFFLDWDETRRDLAAEVERAGAAARIIIVRNGPCTLDPMAEGMRFGGIVVVTPTQVKAGIEGL